jgi:hypothetical protein
MGCRRMAGGPRRAAWAALAFVLPLVLQAEPVSASDASGAPSVDGTLTVAPVAMPAPKTGGKDLAHALGPDGATAARGAIVAELTDLKAFSGIPDSGGDYGLLVTITSFKRSIRELGGHQGESPDSMSFDLEADCAWTRGGEPLDDVAVTIEKSIPLDGPLAKHELEGTVAGMFHELAQRAFSDLFEKRFFQRTGSVSGSGE